MALSVGVMAETSYPSLHPSFLPQEIGEGSGMLRGSLAWLFPVCDTDGSSRAGNASDPTPLPGSACLTSQRRGRA